MLPAPAVGAAGAAPSVPPASGASDRQVSAIGSATTAAQAPTPARHPRAAATVGSTSAAATPPSVSPICLIPIANPRSRGGKRSTMARPSAGFTTLHPIPATTRHARKVENVGAAAAAESPAAPTARPPRKLGRTPMRSASRPPGSEKNRPPT
jgi:hypothetical protein